MMMPLAAELVTEFPVFQKDTADLVGFHQEPQTSIHRGPADAGQGGAQLFSGERASLGRRRAPMTKRRGSVSR